VSGATTMMVRRSDDDRYRMDHNWMRSARMDYGVRNERTTIMRRNWRGGLKIIMSRFKQDETRPIVPHEAKRELEAIEQLLETPDVEVKVPVIRYARLLNTIVDQAMLIEMYRLDIRFVWDTLKEINPSNYDHDDVCAMNAANCEVLTKLTPVVQAMEESND
jgi:hypothetical protein